MYLGLVPKTKAIPSEVRRSLQEKYAEDPEVVSLLQAYAHAEALLRRALWEFGSELRGDIEKFLGERPLLG